MAEHHARLAAEMKKRLKVEELEENIDELEDLVEGVFPVLLLTVVLSFIIFGVFLVRLYLRWCSPNPSQNKLDGKTVLITGTTSGIGKATAIELAKRNARVLITGRDRAKVEAVARNIRKKTGNPYVNALQLDLGNIREIKEFVEEFLQKEKYLHILVNNAAYLGPSAKTNDGLERTFGVNYLGHYYLTRLLLEKMKKNAPSRVINVVCEAYKGGKIDLEDLAYSKGYTAQAAYARSKFAQLLFNNEIHKRNFGHCVWSFAVSPGPTATELYRQFPGTMGSILRLVARIMFKPPEEGANTVVYCAVGDGLRDFSGKLFTNCKAVKTTTIVRANQDLSRRLWNASAELCGLEGDLNIEEELKPEEAAPSEEDKKEL